MRIRIDTEACTGHGRCYSVAPEVFEADDVGYGRVISNEVPPALEQQAQLALRNCPEDAIHIDG